MNPLGKPRRRAIAILLSLGLPGLGELYAGELRRAVLTFAIYYIIAAVGIALVFLPVLGGAVAALPVVVVLAGWIVVAVRAAQAAARAPQPYPLRSYNRWYWYLLAIFVTVFIWQPVVFNLVRSEWVQAFQIPSNAMAPTVLAGDFIFVSKRPPARHVNRNDIVILESPTNDGLYIIKRVVGLPGDTIGMRTGVLIRNRTPVTEAFAQLVDSSSAAQNFGAGRDWQVAHLAGGDVRTYRPDMRNWGPVVVPPDSVFVLGDNRDNSFDSRFWGAVGMDRLRGRPLVVYFSVERTAGGSSIRWNRIGRRF